MVTDRRQAGAIYVGHGARPMALHLARVQDDGRVELVGLCGATLASQSRVDAESFDALTHKRDRICAACLRIWKAEKGAS